MAYKQVRTGYFVRNEDREIVDIGSSFLITNKSNDEYVYKIWNDSNYSTWIDEALSYTASPVSTFYFYSTNKPWIKKIVEDKFQYKDSRGIKRAFSLCCKSSAVRPFSIKVDGDFINEPYSDPKLKYSLDLSESKATLLVSEINNEIDISDKDIADSAAVDPENPLPKHFITKIEITRETTDLKRIKIEKTFWKSNSFIPNPHTDTSYAPDQTSYFDRSRFEPNESWIPTVLNILACGSGGIGTSNFGDVDRFSALGGGGAAVGCFAVDLTNKIGGNGIEIYICSKANINDRYDKEHGTTQSGDWYTGPVDGHFTYIGKIGEALDSYYYKNSSGWYVLRDSPKYSLDTIGVVIQGGGGGYFTRAGSTYESKPGIGGKCSFNKDNCELRGIYEIGHINGGNGGSSNNGEYSADLLHGTTMLYSYNDNYINKVGSVENKSVKGKGGKHDSNNHVSGGGGSLGQGNGFTDSTTTYTLYYAGLGGGCSGISPYWKYSASFSGNVHEATGPGPAGAWIFF